MQATQRTYDDPARYTRDEIKALNKAEAEMARAKDQQAKRVAQAKILAISAKRNQRVVVQERCGGVSETVALAQARGESVDQHPVYGAVCMSDRDGLHTLFKAGHISREHYEAGLIYRTSSEVRGSDLKASSIGDSSGGGHDNNVFVGKRFERAALANFTAKCDRAVAVTYSSNPSTLAMLRAIAGHGHSLRAFGAGRAVERNRDALVLALGVVADLVAGRRK